MKKVKSSVRNRLTSEVTAVWISLPDQELNCARMCSSKCLISSTTWYWSNENVWLHFLLAISDINLSQGREKVRCLYSVVYSNYNRVYVGLALLISFIKSSRLVSSYSSWTSWISGYIGSYPALSGTKRVYSTALTLVVDAVNERDDQRPMHIRKERVWKIRANLFLFLFLSDWIVSFRD